MESKLEFTANPLPGEPHVKTIWHGKPVADAVQPLPPEYEPVCGIATALERFTETHTEAELDALTAKQPQHTPEVACGMTPQEVEEYLHHQRKLEDLQGKLADLLEAAKAALDRLEAWGERHEFLARTTEEGPTCDQHRNQAANYGALAKDLRAAISKATA